MGDDRRFFLEKRVSAGMIAVIVGVNDKANRLVGDALQGRLNFFR